MKNIFYGALVLMTSLLGTTAAYAVSDPSVSGATITPAPVMFPGLPTDNVTFEFRIANNGTSTSSNSVKVTITLVKLAFNDGTFDVATDLEQVGTTPFTWVWDDVKHILTGTLNGDFPENDASTIRIRNLRATEASTIGRPNIGGIANVVTFRALNATIGDDDVSRAYTYSNRIPVDLTSFRGHAGSGCTAELTWGIANALDFSHFEVEYAADARNFTSLGTVAYAEGKTQYSYSHPQGDKQGYYRLKMVDKDGKYKYSTIVTVGVDCIGEAQTATYIFPNPVIDGNCTLNYYSKFKGSAAVQLTDVQGRMLINKQVQVQLGGNSFPISTAGLAAGIYYVRLLDGTLANAMQIRVR